MPNGWTLSIGGLSEMYVYEVSEFYATDYEANNIQTNADNISRLDEIEKLDALMFNMNDLMTNRGISAYEHQNLVRKLTDEDFDLNSILNKYGNLVTGTGIAFKTTKSIENTSSSSHVILEDDFSIWEGSLAFNYLRREIHKINPFVRIVVGRYFNNHPTNSGYSVCACQKAVAEHYSWPLLDTWNYTGISNIAVPNSSGYIARFNQKYGTSYTAHPVDADNNISYFQFYCPDMVHPSSDLTGHSRKLFASIYTKFMANILAGD